jgi:ABC-2 type transport system ATP-binding protein
MNTIVLQTKDLTKVYGRQKVVDAINIIAYAGEVFGFLGPNGAGKTTTLGMALGLVHPTAGEVSVLGKRVMPNHTQALKDVGALLGAPAFVPYLSARDNLELVSRLSPGVDKKRIDEVLELAGLGDSGKKKAGKFSTGMKQRVGLAMALVHRPRLVILDEPTNGLDPAGMREIRQLLRSLADSGTSVLLSSHLLNEVQQVCDRIAVLNRGRVAALGMVTDLLNGNKPTVRLTVFNPTEAADLLKFVPGVENVRCEENTLIVTGVESQVVLNCLVQHNILPSEITVQKNDLEGLFMELTSTN